MYGPFPGMPQVPYDDPYSRGSRIVDVTPQDRNPTDSRTRLARAILDATGGQQEVEHPTQAIGNALGMMAEAKLKKMEKPKPARPVPGSGTMNRKPFARAPRKY